MSRSPDPVVAVAPIQPWEAPTVVDIHVSDGTLGGCNDFISESTYTPGCYAVPLS